jgi:pheromone shutdown protein TraB
MTKIKLIIYNDFDEEVGFLEKKMVKNLNTLDEMESEVEEFRKSMLPEITKILLEESQRSFKKNSYGRE